MGPPNVLGLPKPASSISTSRTFGDPGGASGCPIRFQSGFDPSSVLLLTPWNGSLRIGRFVRSGSLIVCLPPVQDHQCRGRSGRCAGDQPRPVFAARGTRTGRMPGHGGRLSLITTTCCQRRLNFGSDPYFVTVTSPPQEL